MGIKSSFSIKDLENLSRNKAHTIRIWEKRNHFFNPTISNMSDEEIRSLIDAQLLKDRNMSLEKKMSTGTTSLITEIMI